MNVMKISHVLPGLLAVVLAVGAVFASESTAMEPGHISINSEPCEFVRDCNNLPNAPACTIGVQQQLYKLGSTGCTIPLNHYQRP